MAYKSKYKKKPGPRTYMGLPVVDATEPLDFVVTAADCRNAKQNDPENCAAAKAIKRTEGISHVAVHRCVTMLVYKDKAVRYITPHGLRDQVIRGDVNMSKFEIGAYKLKAPSPSMVSGRGRQHSPPDRPRGDPNSKHKRIPAKAIGRIELRDRAA